MRKTFFILIAIACCLVGSNASAQTQADNLKARAQEALDKKEYTQARSLFLHAYNSFFSAASSSLPFSTLTESFHIMYCS